MGRYGNGYGLERGDIPGEPLRPLTYSQAAALVKMAEQNIRYTVHPEQDPRGGWRIIVEERSGDYSIEWAVYSSHAWRWAIRHIQRRVRNNNFRRTAQRRRKAQEVRQTGPHLPDE